MTPDEALQLEGRMLGAELELIDSATVRVPTGDGRALMITYRHVSDTVFHGQVSVSTRLAIFYGDSSYSRSSMIVETHREDPQPRRKA